MMCNIIAPLILRIAFSDVGLFVCVDPHIVFDISVMERIAVIDQSRDPAWRGYAQKYCGRQQIGPREFYNKSKPWRPVVHGGWVRNEIAQCHRADSGCAHKQAVWTGQVIETEETGAAK